eukprot:6190806-Pleurochrysis_carterae.AAC.1
MGRGVHKRLVRPPPRPSSSSSSPSSSSSGTDQKAEGSIAAEGAAIEATATRRGCRKATAATIITTTATITILIKSAITPSSPPSSPSVRGCDFTCQTRPQHLVQEKPSRNVGLALARYDHARVGVVETVLSNH